MSWDAWGDRDRIIAMLTGLIDSEKDLIAHNHILERKMADISTDVQSLTDLATTIQQSVGSVQGDLDAVIAKLNSASGQGNLTPDQQTTMESTITVLGGVRDALGTMHQAAQNALNVTPPAPAPAPAPAPDPNQPAPPAPPAQP